MVVTIVNVFLDNSFGDYGRQSLSNPFCNRTITSLTTLTEDFTNEIKYRTSFVLFDAIFQ